MPPKNYKYYLASNFFSFFAKISINKIIFEIEQVYAPKFCKAASSFKKFDDLFTWN